MDSRERIKAIIGGESPDRCGLWLGNPHPDTRKILHTYFGTKNLEKIRQQLNDDFRWICPQFFPDAYKDPQGHGIFAVDKKQHGQVGPLTNCEDVEELDTFPWPNPDYLSFDSCIEALRKAGNYYRASGMWTSFFIMLWTCSE